MIWLFTKILQNTHILIKYASALQICNYMQNKIWSMEPVRFDMQTFLILIVHLIVLSTNMRMHIIPIFSYKL